MIGQEYRVGRFDLLLPQGHMLGEYQARWHRYDVPLGEIARLTFAKYPAASLVDVGANIGDSLALMLSARVVPALAVEGNPAFLPFLQENTQRIGTDIEIEEAFVGIDGGSVPLSGIAGTQTTASISASTQTENGIPTRSLATILGTHPRFADSRLMKIDTDGSDFTFIADSVAELAGMRPVLFFEYDPGFSDAGEEEALRAVSALFEIEYHDYAVYDNYGNFLMTTHDEGTFEELNAYLRSNRRNGIAVYYLDVCAFSPDDEDLFAELRRHELSQ